MFATLTPILALIRKEFLALLKDPRSRVTLIAPALMQALLFGYGATHDLHRVPYALHDASNSAASTALLARMDGTGIFHRVATLPSSLQIAAEINTGRALIALSIPSDFEARLSNGDTAPIQALLDGRHPSNAGLALNALGTILADFNASHTSTPAPVLLERRAWHNPNLETRWEIMSGLIAVLSLIQTLLISALSVAREREHGTFDQLLLTPLAPLQILIGKAIPAITVGLIQSTIILLIIRFWLGVPMSGSLTLIYLGLTLFNCAVAGIGLSISALSLNMQQAMRYTFLLLIPLILLSGILTPVRNMPEILQLATWVNPVRFGVRIVRSIYLEGASLAQIGTDLVRLLAIAAITLPLAAWLFRHRLA